LLELLAAKVARAVLRGPRGGNAPGLPDHWSLRGIHGGELEGTAPTGKSVYVDGQLLSRIADGTFVEEWVHWDTLGLLRQIGAVPSPKT
jgi:hypothetical protein